MRDHVRFRSAAFIAAQGEDRMTNPGRYGHDLASWVVARLRAADITVGEPIAEDWGWVVEVRQSDRSFSIACGNVDGEDDQWLLWMEPEKTGFVRRLIGKPNDGPGGDARSDLLRRIDQWLREEASVSDIEWFRSDARLQEIDHGPHP